MHLQFNCMVALSTSFHFIFRLAAFFLHTTDPNVFNTACYSAVTVAQRERKAICFSCQRPFTIDQAKLFQHLVSLLIQFIQWLSSSSRTHTGSGFKIDFNTWNHWLDFLFACACARAALQFSSKNGRWLLNQSWHNNEQMSEMCVKSSSTSKEENNENQVKAHVAHENENLANFRCVTVFLSSVRWCNWAHHSQLASKFYIVFAKTVNHPFNPSINQTKSYRNGKALFWA